MRIKEKDLGVTLNGPHRDEISFIINQKSAKTFASEGQKKTLVTALKMAEWKRLALEVGTKPLMVIDDFGNALDTQRRDNLTKSFASMHQVFLTTPHSLDLIENGHFLKVNQGQIIAS